MPILAPAAVIATFAGISAFRAKQQKRGEMTPERTAVYDVALLKLKDPVKLRKLADVFDGVGLRAQGNVLRKRAALRELPPDIKKARKAILRKALQSTDPAAVRKVADAFRADGATGAADKLDAYATGLEAQPQKESA